MNNAKRIPKDWKVTTIGQVATVSTGGTPRTNNPEYWDGDIPWMSSGEVNARRVRSTERTISELGLANCNSAIFPKGSVMVALAGQGTTRGKAAILDIDAACNQSLAALQSLNAEVLLNEYLFFNLESRYLELRNINGNAGRSGLNLNLIKDIKLAIPTASEQRNIVEILNNIDSRIESTQKIIDQTTKLKAGLMQRLFTKGIGHTEYKKSKLGLIPREWEIKTLGEVGTNTIGLTYSPADVVKEGGTLVFRSSNIRDGMISYEDNVFVSKQIRENLITKPGDILLCTRNGSRRLIGKSALIDAASAGNSFGAFMSVFRTQYSDFVFQLFQSPLFRIQIEKHLGATINQITTGVLNTFIFAFPPLAEQKEIVTILNAVDEKILLNRKLKDRFQRLKTGLLRDLTTGKVLAV